MTSDSLSSAPRILLIRNDVADLNGTIQSVVRDVADIFGGKLKSIYFQEKLNEAPNLKIETSVSAVDDQEMARAQAAEQKRILAELRKEFGDIKQFQLKDVLQKLPEILEKKQYDMVILAVDAYGALGSINHSNVAVLEQAIHSKQPDARILCVTTDTRDKKPEMPENKKLKGGVSTFKQNVTKALMRTQIANAANKLLPEHFRKEENALKAALYEKDESKPLAIGKAPEAPVVIKDSTGQPVEHAAPAIPAALGHTGGMDQNIIDSMVIKSFENQKVIDALSAVIRDVITRGEAIPRQSPLQQLLTEKPIKKVGEVPDKKGDAPPEIFGFGK